MLDMSTLPLNADMHSAFEVVDNSLAEILINAPGMLGNALL